MSMRPLVLAPLAGLALAGLLGCGSGGNRSKLLPQSDDTAIKDHVAKVGTAADERQCGRVTFWMGQLRTDLAGLPKAVAPDLRRRLPQGVFDKLVPAARRECDAAQTDTVP